MRTRKGKRGITLVEVMVAGAIVSVLVVAFFAGIVTSAKVSRESSELLAAEAYAWDVAWKWFNMKDENLNKSAEPIFYPSGGAAVSSNECPMIYRTDAPALCFVRVTGLVPVNTNVSAYVKRIEVNVEWGASGGRRWLNKIGAPDDVRPENVYNVPITIYKSPIDRGI